MQILSVSWVWACDLGHLFSRAHWLCIWDGWACTGGCAGGGRSSSSRSWKLKERRGIGPPMRAGSLTGSSPNGAACRDLHAPSQVTAAA